MRIRRQDSVVPDIKYSVLTVIQSYSRISSVIQPATCVPLDAKPNLPSVQGYLTPGQSLMS